MIMDDDTKVREIAARMLEHLGYNVIEVEDGEAAIAEYRKNLDGKRRINCVIMDLTIPGGQGGKETAAIIRTIDPNAKLIVASGYSQDPVMAQYRQYGFAGVLSKPFQLRELQQTVKKVIEG